MPGWTMAAIAGVNLLSGGNRGGGGGGAPTSQTVSQTNIPDYAKPYVDTMLGAGQQQLFNYVKDPTTGQMVPDTLKPFTPFGIGAPGAQQAGRYNANTGQYDFNPLGSASLFAPTDQIMQGAGGGGGGWGGALGNISPTIASQFGPQNLFKNSGMGFGGDAFANLTNAQVQPQYQTGMGPQEMQAAQSAVAGFSPLQQRAAQGIAGLQMPGQITDASNAAAQATQQALGTGYRAGRFGNQFQAPGQYNPGQFSMAQAQAPELQQFQMGPAQQVGTQSYTGENVSQYMSPYMQNVVDIQKREAQRASDIAGTQQAGQAVKSGAFGGSRAGLLEAERQRNLATQMGDIQATGQQAAFQNAQQQFNAQQQANMQAALANQQAGLTVGGQNLGAQLGIQQLGAGQNLQAQLANQQAFQAAQQAAEQSRQFGAGQGLTSAQLGAQYGLAGQQLGEQSRQFGAGLGLQGTQAALQGASTLGNLGGQQLQAQQGIYGLQNQMGAAQQAQQQNIINQAIQNYANTIQYPQQQLGFMNSLLRGLPMSSSNQTSYQAPPSMVSQLAGLGMGAYGLSQMKKKGGAIKAKAPDNRTQSSGLMDLALNKIGA